MAGVWKTIRVFISSTFRDMHAERDWLVKRVFPALREQLDPHRIHLIDIDLRWGVTKEQAENDQALDVCLDQIDECRPFFLGILGERYGWVSSKLPDHVASKYGWIRHHIGKSITELEILYGVLQNTEMRGHAFFYFRDPRILQAVPGEVRRTVYAETDSERIEKLADLKQKIRLSGYPVLENYPTRWDPELYDRPSKSNGRLTDLEVFGERVRDQLWQAIQAEFQLSELTRETRPDPLAEELDYHNRFMESRLRIYVGREQINRDLFSYAEGNDPVACLVTGPSGSGKSAALARFVVDYRQKHEQSLVVPHFVGASPRSTNLRDTLTRFCHVLKAWFGFAEEVPQEAAKLTALFHELLYKVPKTERVLLVIDALNQFDETHRAHELDWLPAQLPPHVKIVASCIVESGQASQVLEAFGRRKHLRLAVAPLSNAERETILHQVPLLSAKTLDNDQVRRLLSNPSTTNPLFLLVALEELRGFGSYEQLNDRIAALPQEGLAAEVVERAGFSHQAMLDAGDAVTALFLQVIERMEVEFDAELVRTVLVLLASARHGLAERELQNLAAPLPGVDDLFPVLRQLRPYLLSRGGLVDFFHRNLYKAVRRRYLSDAESEQKAHTQLATYFRGRWSDPDDHALSELPYHLAHARMWMELETVLCDLTFLELKAKHISTANLLLDLESAQVALEAALPSRQATAPFAAVRHLRDYLRLHLQFFAKYPDVLASSIRNDSPQEIKACLTGGASQRSIRIVSASAVTAEPDRLIHADRVLSIDLSPTGSVATGAADRTIKLWQSATGELLRTFEISSHAVYVRFLEGGQRLVSVSSQGIIGIRDVATGDLLEEFRVLGDFEAKDVIQVGGARLALHSQIWDLNERALVARVGDESKDLLGIASPNGRWGVGSGLKVWDLQTGKLAWQQQAECRGLAFLDDDRFVAGGNVLTLWSVSQARSIESRPAKGSVLPLDVQGDAVLLQAMGGLSLYDVNQRAKRWRVDPKYSFILAVRGNPAADVVLVSSAYGSSETGWQAAVECFSWGKGVLRWKHESAQKFADLR